MDYAHVGECGYTVILPSVAGRLNNGITYA